MAAEYAQKEWYTSQDRILVLLDIVKAYGVRIVCIHEEMAYYVVGIC